MLCLLPRDEEELRKSLSELADPNPKSIKRISSCSNPFLDFSQDPSIATYKYGILVRKSHAEPDCKKSTCGRQDVWCAQCGDGKCDLGLAFAQVSSGMWVVVLCQPELSGEVLICVVCPVVSREARRGAALASPKLAASRKKLTF